MKIARQPECIFSALVDKHFCSADVHTGCKAMLKADFLSTSLLINGIVHTGHEAARTFVAGSSHVVFGVCSIFCTGHK